MRLFIELIMKATLSLLTTLALVFGFIAAPGSLSAASAEKDESLGFSDTPFLPGGKWRVHDIARPQPPAIIPPVASTQDRPGRPPSDARILFDGRDLSQWRTEKDEVPRWILQDGAMIVPPKGSPGGGTIHTVEEFGDCQLHLEFCHGTPDPNDKGQKRSNSGVIFMGRYELQVLDNYNNPTYADGTVGAVYGQTPPLVNACRPPGEWQTYDILFTAPRFAADGALESPARFTVLLNGVVVQNNTASIGQVRHKEVATYRPHPPKAPLVLQDHNNPVRFRNIWIRPLGEAGP